MALVLRLTEGRDFYVTDVRVVLSRLFNGAWLELRVPETNHRYEVGEEEPVEMKEAEEVWFQSGGCARSGEARIIIDAPKEFLVTMPNQARFNGTAVSSTIRRKLRPR